MLTLAAAVHSRHYRGERRLFSFYVQDRGPRNVRTWEPRFSHKLELEGMEIPV